MNMYLSEVACAVDGQLSGKDQAIFSVSINTRTLVKGDLFIAVKGQNHDGHKFLDKARLMGAIAVLVNHKVDLSIPQVIVADTKLALAKLAGVWKSKTAVKTLAVTGSNGKTTVKEMLAGILGLDAKVLFTQGNLNNDFGVPLTLLRLNKQHQYAVIEMGANHIGEIGYSSHYTKPEVAVITNVSAAHLAGFGSLDSVARAKGEIIQSLGERGIVILNRDDDYYEMWLEMSQKRKVVSFGLNQLADISAEEIVAEILNNEFITCFKLTTATGEIPIRLRLAGQHNVINALAAAAASLQMGISLAQIKQGLENLKPMKGRLQPIIGEQGNLIIDDSYNANPSSVVVALDVLTKCKGESWVILGALGELGAASQRIHGEVGELMKLKNVVRLLTIGSDAKSTSDIFGKGATFFSSQQQLISALKEELKGHETLLIKGSRAQKMENIVAALTPVSGNKG